jgi:alpha-L-arabinofuranosidase
MVGRRQFLRSGLMLGGAVFISRYAPYTAAAARTQARIEVLLEEPLGQISPDIYGHFTEHLGGVIYDGIWVGPDSKVPNVNGLRKALVEHMRKIHAPVVRYPGGCFADSYDWKDGVGPVDKRPRRTNFWMGADNDVSPASHKYEPNRFGTNEFVQFCREIGSQPYLAANLRSLTAEDFYRWVEYCNSPSGTTSLSDLRASSGFADPFHVRFWGIGNESWGCGGNFTAQEYAVEFRRFTTWVPGYGENLAFVASGPNGDDREWTRSFLEELVRKDKSQLKTVYGMSLHDYAWNLSRGRTTDWNKGKGDALNFDAVDWYELLREGDRMESMLTGHWEVMNEIDHEHQVKLIVDEWGPWYKPGSEATAGDILEQTPTLRDAVFSGMTLDTFNRHPEKVAMANCAQLVNCLNSLYLAHEDRFVVTPVGQVFELYAPHQGGQSLRTIFSAPAVVYDRDGQKANFWGLKGSASLKGKTLFLTVVNPNVSEPQECEIAVPGASLKSGSSTVLTAPDIHAHNTFEQPHGIVPSTRSLTGGKTLTLSFPPASVSALTLELV